MFKLANQVIDIYDDVCLEGIRKIASLRPTVSVLSPEEHSRLSDGAFALSMITKKAAKLNKFPIDTADNTWLSNQYFDMNAHKLPKLAAQIAGFHIKTACAKFNLQPTDGVVKLAAPIAPPSNSYFEEADGLRASPKGALSHGFDKLAQVQQIGDNYTFAQNAMPSQGHVKAACQYFDKHVTKIPLEMRHKYAAAVQKRAAELGMPAQAGTVAKYASDGYSGAIDAHIRMRASLLDAINPRAKETLEKMAAMKSQVSPKEFAQALFTFDKKAGLTRYYNGQLTNPFEATFAPVQHAPKLLKTASGNQVAPDALASVVNEKHAEIKSYFGQSVADEMKKNPTAIFESLPNDAKEIIVNIANGCL